MKFLVELREGGIMPRGYGMAWRRWDRLTAVCAPMPLHVILRVVRSAYYRFVWLWQAEAWERLLMRAQRCGRDEGRIDHLRLEERMGRAASAKLPDHDKTACGFALHWEPIGSESAMRATLHESFTQLEPWCARAIQNLGPVPDGFHVVGFVKVQIVKTEQP